MCGELSLNDDENYDKEKATRSLFFFLLSPFLHHDTVCLLLLYYSVAAALLLRSSIVHSLPPFSPFSILSSTATACLLTASLEETIYDRFAIDMKIKNSWELTKRYIAYMLRWLGPSSLLSTDFFPLLFVSPRLSDFNSLLWLSESCCVALIGGTE